jgi:hypothetical protein
VEDPTRREGAEGQPKLLEPARPALVVEDLIAEDE